MGKIHSCFRSVSVLQKYIIYVQIRVLGVRVCIVNSHESSNSALPLTFDCDAMLIFHMSSPISFSRENFETRRNIGILAASNGTMEGGGSLMSGVDVSLEMS